MKIIKIITTILIIASLAIYFTLYDSKRIKKLHIEYENVSSADKLNGKIQNLYTEKGACFVTLDSKKVFFKTSRNYNYSPSYLDDFLNIGDLLRKNVDSDTLYVYRNNESFYFVLGKFINKK